MATTITLDPVSRIEGHLKVEVTIDVRNSQQQVVDARATGTLFRGFEAVLVGRDAFDAPDITARICGVCPTSHSTAAVKALDQAMGLTVTHNGRLLRNLVLGADFLHSHILHFYHLAALDYLEGPAMAPWQPAWSADRRLPAATTQTLVNHYVKALEMRRKAHEIGALIGGRLPHAPAIVPGGVPFVPPPAALKTFRTVLKDLRGFISGTYIPDVEALAAAYQDYFDVGAGPQNLVAFGVFDEDLTGGSLLLGRGRVLAGRADVLPLDVNQIAEDVAGSWYGGADGLKPAGGATTPAYPKSGAYSWIKAPRYAGLSCEVGPLARMTVNGDYSNGVSVMDRHRARALEALKIADAMLRWLDQVSPSAPAYTQGALPTEASGVGLTEAPRGALGHWMGASAGRLNRYQIVTPTCWNASPRDAKRIPGPLEQALIGTPVSDLAQPIEVLRVIHSFDPCLSCAVHVMRPGAGQPVAVI